MLNLFFMLRLFFHFFPQRRGFQKRKRRIGMGEWVQLRECDDFILFFSFPTTPLPSFCVQKLLFSSDLFPEKKIYGEFFLLPQRCPPPSRNHNREFLYSFVPCYPLPFYSLRFFLGRNEKIHFQFFSRFLYIKKLPWKGGMVGVAHLYGTSEMKKNEKARNGVHGFLHFSSLLF